MLWPNLTSMETTWFEIGDVLVRSPVTAGTNLIVSVQCMLYALRLYRSKSGKSRFQRSHFWGGFFGMMSVATAAGVLKHGARHAMSDVVFAAVLGVSNVAGAAATYFAQRAALADAPRNTRRGWLALAHVQLAMFAVANAVVGPELWVLVANTAVGLPPVIVAEVRRLGRIPGVGWIAAGLCASVLTGAVYVTGLSLGPWFNHMDIAHALMAVCFLLIYRGVAAATRRPMAPEARMTGKRRSFERLATSTLFICAGAVASATPAHATPQQLAEIVRPATPTLVPAPPALASDAVARACAALDEGRGEVWRRAVASRSLTPDAADELLRSLEVSLAAAAAVRPDDVAVQYELAVVLGMLADLENGSGQVEVAEALDHQIEVVLALEPEHAGAQHLHGRLQAAVLRMSSFKRFVATRILGGRRLADASWEDARARLEAAVGGDPCIPDHHYELARLYSDRDEPTLAARQLERFFEVTGSRELFADVLRKGRELAAELSDD